MASPGALSGGQKGIHDVPQDPVNANSASKPVGDAGGTPAAFKIVKVRKPDGSIIKVRRPITATSNNLVAPSTQNAAPSTSSAKRNPGSISEAAPRTTVPTESQSTSTGTATNTQDVRKEPGGPECSPAKTKATENPTIKSSTGKSLQTVSGVETMPSTKPLTTKTAPNDLVKAQSVTRQSVKKETPLADSARTSSGPPSAAERHIQAAATLSGFGFLARIGASKAIQALAPEWDLSNTDDMQEGDILLNDNDYDTDLSDDDDGYDRTDDEDQDSTADVADGSKDMSATDQNQQADSTENSEIIVPKSDPKDQNGRGMDSEHGDATTAKPDQSDRGLSQSDKQLLPSLPTSTRAYNRAPASAVTEKDSAKVAENNTPNGESGKPTRVTEKEVGSDGDLKPIKPPVKGAYPLHRASALSRIIVWLIMTGLPLMFIALGIETATLRGTLAKSTRGVVTEQAIKIAVTAWPIIFAAIVAQSLKAFATYRVERGIKLMALEQLISSNSVASAIKQPFFLRRLDFISVALLCLWGLSPIASQALQNMLYIVPKSTDGVVYNVTYMDLTAANPNFFGASAGSQINFVAIDTLFAAALAPRGKVEKSGVDPYLFPMLPAVHLLDDWKNSNATADGWYSAADAASAGSKRHASLYGVYSENPVQKTDIQNGTAKFVMKSSYFRLVCSAPTKKTWPEVEATGLSLTGSKTGTLFMAMQPPMAGNLTAEGSTVNLQGTGTGNLTFVSSMPAEGNFGDANYVSPNQTVAYVTCNMNQTFVEAELGCGADTCIVQRMRLTPNPDYTPPVRDFTSGLVNAASGAAQYPFPTVVELYVNDTGSVLNPIHVSPDLTRLSQPDFEQKLALLLNTYWHLGFGAMYQTGSGNMDGTATPLKYADASWTSPSTDIYELNIAWLVVLFVCSATLLGAGVASALWEHQTIGPDILGFASSIVRQSKYVSVPKGDSTMSGPRQAALMKDAVVMMQDVKPNGEVGKIALGTISPSSARLQHGRLYR